MQENSLYIDKEKSHQRDMTRKHAELSQEGSSKESKDDKFV